MDKSKAADQLPVSFINETNRHFFGNRKQSADLAENTIFTCKILTKALHGLENLLTTMKKDENETYQAPSNWLQVNTDYFQLWDILEVAKVIFIIYLVSIICFLSETVCTFEDLFFRNNFVRRVLQCKVKLSRTS